MPELVLAVDLTATPEDTWSAALDWEQQGQWILATRVRPLDGGAQALGARVEAFTGIGRLGVLDELVVTVWDPPRRCEVRHVGRWLRGAGAFEVQGREGGGARFIWSEWLAVPGGPWGELAWRVARPLMKAGGERSLRNFASFVTSR